MRFYAYAGASTALATGVLIRALHERANFYSACVYVAQSNACVMILANLLLLILGLVLYGLQQLLYGPLRPIEVEQLYEKAWFAITETCLAMTIFREEIGVWFVVMFVSLLIGKVWGWIGDGRVEILEQQPPANPRLFHARLSTSLALSLLFDMYLLNYSITTVRQQARPNMMVMFAFEFAVLSVTSLSTCARYGLSLREAAVVKRQTSQRLQERREQIIREREEMRRQAEANGEVLEERPPVDDELNELDIDVPGWEEKGRWAFYLDLATDFLKLVLYLTFFCVLCIFYGMPIHIIRDVAMTIRSFYNRLTDFVKYRAATKDMNERYPDATAADMGNEDVCIICRETMRPWQRADPNVPAQTAPMEERLRAKKLPCGHVLHFACLRSWLERQQKCPTCRADVVASPQSANGAARQTRRPGAAQPEDQRNHGQHAQDAAAQNRGGQNRVRHFHLGPLRFGFGAVNDPALFAEDLANRGREQQPEQRQPHAGRRANIFSFSLGRPRQQPEDIPAQLQNIEQQLMRQMSTLMVQEEQLRAIMQIQGTLAQLRAREGTIAGGESIPGPGPQRGLQWRPENGATRLWAGPNMAHGYAATNGSDHGIRAGDPDLPPGLSIPEGWQLIPLYPHQNLAVPRHSHNSFPGYQTTGVNNLAVPIPTQTAGTFTFTQPEPARHGGPAGSPFPGQNQFPVHNHFPVQNRFPFYNHFPVQNQHPVPHQHPVQNHVPAQNHVPVQHQHPVQHQFPLPVARSNPRPTSNEITTSTGSSLPGRVQANTAPLSSTSSDQPPPPETQSTFQRAATNDSPNLQPSSIAQGNDSGRTQSNTDPLGSSSSNQRPLRDLLRNVRRAATNEPQSMQGVPSAQGDEPTKSNPDDLVSIPQWGSEAGPSLSTSQNSLNADSLRSSTETRPRPSEGRDLGPTVEDAPDEDQD